MIENNNQNSRREILFAGLSSLFIVVLIVSNMVAAKVCRIPFFPNFALPCGLLTYPLTFLIGDLVTELYGGNRARWMVYIGFVLCLISQGILLLALNLPPHPDWVSTYNPYGYADTQSYQHAFESIFGLNGLALISSMAAYAVSQLMDIRLFGFIKEITKSKHMWLRSCSSTLISQVIDTLVVNTLFLYCGLKLDLSFVVYISLFCYLYKAFVAVASIPLFYGSVWLSRKYLTMEVRPLELQPEMSAS